MNRSSCPFQLLRQGFLSHSGPIPGLDLVFRRADPVLSIRSHDVNRYTCFSSEFLFGPLNARELLKIIECFGVFRNWAESQMKNVQNFESSVSKVWTFGQSQPVGVDPGRSPGASSPSSRRSAPRPVHLRVGSRLFLVPSSAKQLFPPVVFA